MTPLRRSATFDLQERKASPDGVRSFPCTISTETPVPRRDRFTGEEFSEVLSHAPGAVDLSRAPLPVIESHDRSRVNVGILSNLRLDGRRLRGELVLGASQRGQELAADIAAGIVTGLSVGYQITKEERDEKAKRQTATRWMPFEVSIVSVPADINAGIGRSAAVDNEPQNSTPPDNTEQIRERAVKDERERVAGIRLAARATQLGDEFTNRLIDAGTPLDQARGAILNELVRRSDETPISTHLSTDAMLNPRRSGVEFSQRGSADDFRAAATDALVMRSGIRIEKPHAAARDLLHTPVLELARTCLSRDGKRHSMMSQGEVLKRAFSTSDFPEILANSIGKSIRSGWEAEPSSHRQWVSVESVPDFRDQLRPLLGSAPALELIEELGEYKYGSMAEDAASFRVRKHGKALALSYELLKNDQLGVFLRVKPALGASARRAEADAVYALFAENSGAGPTMGDSVTLFHAASHKNVTAAAAMDAAGLGAARTMLRKQVALGGGFMALAPRTLLCAPENETAAEMLLASATRTTTGNTEGDRPEWISRLQLVVEPRLSALNAYYVIAGHEQTDHVVLGLLDENMNGPVTEEESEFVRDAFHTKVRHVFGAAALDWRGMVKVPLAP